MRQAFAAIAFALSAQAALAEGPAQPPPAPCQLPRIASLDMQTEPNGLVTVPVTVAGRAGRWLVDTGNVTSMISDTVATQLNLSRGMYYAPGTMMGGVSINEFAIVPSLEFAGMRAGKSQLSVAPEFVLENDTIGMLAPDIMQHYDIDFDFAAGRLNVFSASHCPGKVVYWTKGNYAQVPMKLDSDGHITIPVTLDGKAMTAVVDTGAQGSTMSMATFESLFRIGGKDAALKPLGNVSVNETKPTAAYRYPFATLSFEGVQVISPNIVLLKDTRMGDDDTGLLLGIETLRQLHMYIAYQEGNIYLTPAEAR
ncbi:MAG TPA: pepsin/retropepsin-like aspartic protease family protein [Rhizomicrobium sp.]|jgi:predicted aspartyl protease|nr:pepsin/retropepsin-like aspartic protease family protein [Rhizomicrobium sp.]